MLENFQVESSCLIKQFFFTMIFVKLDVYKGQLYNKTVAIKQFKDNATSIKFTLQEAIIIKYFFSFHDLLM